MIRSKVCDKDNFYTHIYITCTNRNHTKHVFIANLVDMVMMGFERLTSNVAHTSLYVGGAELNLFVLTEDLLH